MFNRVTLIGHVGKDPEFRSTQSGSRVCTFSLATNETWRDRNSGERKEATEWHTIVVWNEHLHELIEKYVNKGDRLFVEGQIKTRKWEDQNGNDRWTTEIVLNSGFNSQIKLMSPKGEGGGGSRREGGGRREPREDYDAGRHQTGGGGRGVNDDLDDEIPFASNDLYIDPAFRKHKTIA